MGSEEAAFTPPGARRPVLYGIFAIGFVYVCATFAGLSGGLPEAAMRRLRVLGKLYTVTAAPPDSQESGDVFRRAGSVLRGAAARPNLVPVGGTSYARSADVEEGSSTIKISPMGPARGGTTSVLGPMLPAGQQGSAGAEGEAKTGDDDDSSMKGQVRGPMALKGKGAMDEDDTSSSLMKMRGPTAVEGVAPSSDGQMRGPSMAHFDAVEHML